MSFEMPATRDHGWLTAQSPTPAPMSKRHCHNCGQVAPGTPYSTSGPAGVSTALHICFECVLDRMRPLS